MTSRPGIYTPLGRGDYELCFPVDKADFERIAVLINGAAQRAGWKPIQMRIIREDEGESLAPSDSPWLGSWALIFRSSVLNALGPVLERYGELLPLSCPDADLWIYNPTVVIDALDEESSDLDRFSDGRIMMIHRHVFRPDVVAGNEIFKLPALRASETFVSHRFVDRWRAAGLKGLAFERVWDAPADDS